MNKTEIFAEILEAVSYATEVPPCRICSHVKETEVVDARSILAKLLHEAGIYPAQIADFLGLTPSCVRRLLTDYEQRVQTNKMMARYAQHIRNTLASKH